MVCLKRFIVCFLCLAFAFSFNVGAVSTSAKASVVINGDNCEIIYSQNADEKLSMASTTKIMTGLLLCEYGNFEKEITVNQEMIKVEGSSMGLLAGDKVTLHDLLYGLMLASGNDAANVIAYTIGGSLNGFVDMMNQKAKELGLKNTSFATPSGLDDKNHYTTAYELALMTAYAMKNKEFAKAVSTEKAVLNYGNPPYKRSLTNHNKLLRMYEDCVGVKTGFTKKSGRCLVSAAKRDGKFVIAVTLHDSNDWNDHINLLDYGLDSIKQTKYLPKYDNFNIPIVNGTSENLKVDIEPIVINFLETEGITDEVYLPRFLYAPVNSGDIIGKIVYYQNGRILRQEKIVANENIKQIEETVGPIDKIIKNVKFIFKNF